MNLEFQYPWLLHLDSMFNHWVNLTRPDGMTSLNLVAALTA